MELFARPSVMMTRCEKEGLTTASTHAVQDEALNHPYTAFLAPSGCFWYYTTPISTGNTRHREGGPSKGQIRADAA